MSHKVAVVTGSNKGIGYGIVKELCKRGVGNVYLTARDVKRGMQAVENLRKENLNPKFHQLDVTDSESIKTFADYLKFQHGGFDILINNAAVTIENFDEILYEDSKNVIDINYRSLLKIQDHMFPLLKNNARVINMSSNFGHLSNMKNKYWIERLTNENLQIEDINDFVNWFLESVKNNELNEEDFETTTAIAYRISKVAVAALTRVQQKNIDRGISINSLHPGFVRTDMTKKFGDLTIEEACEAPVYLALDCDQSVKGKYFWFDKSEKDWTDTTLKLFSEDKTGEVKRMIEFLFKTN